MPPLEADSVDPHPIVSGGIGGHEERAELIREGGRDGNVGAIEEGDDGPFDWLVEPAFGDHPSAELLPVEVNG
jgi:hypothetical protein